jgi:nitrite reductase (NO-forming)
VPFHLGVHGVEDLAIVEMTMQVPGRFLLVDHSIVRTLEKGAIGVIEVSGDEQPGIFKVLTARAGGTGGH